jgi:hypothetical protein
LPGAGVKHDPHSEYMRHGANYIGLWMRLAMIWKLRKVS